MSINYKKIFQDILDIKFPEKKELRAIVLQREINDFYDVLSLNKMIFGDESKENNHKTASIISKEAEKEIVKNLEVFERKKQFTSQGLSATQMAASLKTNTKYLSFILKKYRGNDFYNYLNEMRINYIVKALYEDPKLLKYKISVLSDMCGYNTHSQFASAFKQIKDITPSQFITNLKNEKRL